MKQTNMFFARVAGLMTSAVSSKVNANEIFVEQLPMPAKTFVLKYFPHKTIAYAEMNIDSMGAAYTINLNDGTEIDFNVFGDWKSVNCHLEAVPQTLVSEPMAQKVKNLFGDVEIVNLTKTDDGYEAILSNAISMRFVA
jgi:hypothetical protein